MLQYDAMANIKSAVVDSALWTGSSEPEVEALGLPLVQVYCHCPFDIARERFFLRFKSGSRHRGYCEEQMTTEDYERFRPLLLPLHLNAPLVCVDTTTPTEASAIVDDIHRAAG